eukprot:snap_masked-scaffold_10-processed-gene-12.49-mRNA-1 protein AED:1.00 eAED:1.00 QI:0/0/0/0/1/1/2/0/88
MISLPQLIFREISFNLTPRVSVHNGDGLRVKKLNLSAVSLQNPSNDSLQSFNTNFQHNRYSVHLNFSITETSLLIFFLRMIKDLGKPV